MIYRKREEYEAPRIEVELMPCEQGFYLSVEFETGDGWDDEEEDEWI